MSVCSKKGVEFFKEIHLAVIIRETGKVVFDSEFSKLEAFKKLKKPK